MKCHPKVQTERKSDPKRISQQIVAPNNRGQCSWLALLAAYLKLISQLKPLINSFARRYANKAVRE